MKTLNDTKSQVIELLRITDEEYAQLQYDQGIEYLERYIPNDPHGIDLLQRSETYWQWWKNHWCIRDRRFLCVNDHARQTENLIHEYRRTHAAKYLVSDIYPPAVVLGNDYAKMIRQINHEIKL